MNVIRFCAQTYFLGSVITVFLADIECSVISATTTCVQNNIQWVFGPGIKGGVFNFSRNTGYPLKLVDNLWPIPIRWFAKDYQDADPLHLRSDPFVKPEELSRARETSSKKSSAPSPASISKPVSIKANPIQYQSQTPPETPKKFPNPYNSAISATRMSESATEIEALRTAIASGPFGKAYAQERLSRLIKADIPIGSRRPDNVLTPLIHERLGRPTADKIQFAAGVKYTEIGVCL